MLGCLLSAVVTTVSSLTLTIKTSLIRKESATLFDITLKSRIGASKSHSSGTKPMLLKVLTVHTEVLTVNCTVSRLDLL